ncbi:aspartate/glutamate racemase family protein [Primorskyibacter sp. 2E233]|uniref:aspartate/glutamate racemase family protein n=1 Tax=Primorskyibacter sp. 2E233 TaxID=3413431 RepID=UPI003BF325A3
MIVLINPNSTEAMTAAMVRIARATAPHMIIEGVTNAGGPPAIQGAEDGAAAVPSMLDHVKQASDKGARAIIIGCFDDTGLDEAREIAACPVLGIGQAAYLLACACGGRFSVVTTLSVSVPVLEGNIHRYGLDRHLARVRASEVPVLALESDPDSATRRVLDEVRAAEAQDGVTSVVLGCGGMGDIAAKASGHSRAMLIDGVRAATVMASAL